MPEQVELFNKMFRTQDYKKMQKLIEKALLEQWNDIIYSGLINDIFKNYKNFFVNRRGVKIKVKKNFKKADEDELTSIADVKQQEKENLNADKITVPEVALKMGLLLSFLRSKVQTKMRSLNMYYSFKSEMKGFLKKMGNIGGQSILDDIPTVKPLKFRLSKREYIEKISKRVETLIKDLDKTTKKRMVTQLVDGIRRGDTKGKMIKELQKSGKRFAKNRAKSIVMTETASIGNYIRYECAYRNGATHKVWQTAQDERVCPTCAPLNAVKKPMKDRFGSVDFSGMYPPAHPLCRCDVYYEVKENMCTSYLKSKNGFDKIDNVFEKVKQKEFYTITREDCQKCFNPNAVWAGGESLVGKDKDIGNLYNEIKSSHGVIRTKLLAESVDKLSPEGNVQLRLKLGLKV